MAKRIHPPAYLDERRPEVEAAACQIGHVDAYEHAAGATRYPQDAIAGDDE